MKGVGHILRRVVPGRQLIVLGGASIVGMGIGFAAASAQYAGARTEVLVKSGTSDVGEPLAYPGGQPEITVAGVTLPVGAQGGWHRHDVPFVVYLLEGELTVESENGQSRRYRAGQAFVEAFRSYHRGRNSGTTPVRAIAFYIGSVGQPNSIPRGN